jgi:ATP-dependent Clp protease ATP-binding subunit ClpC
MLRCVFEAFTESAREVMVIAQDAARDLRHRQIGTEHVLLGLVSEREGLAAAVLRSLGVDLERLAAEVVRLTPPGSEVAAGQMPLSAMAERGLMNAREEATRLGHSYVGTEHLLLRISCDEDALAVRVLRALGIEPKQVRDEVGLLVQR